MVPVPIPLYSEMLWRNNLSNPSNASDLRWGKGRIGVGMTIEKSNWKLSEFRHWFSCDGRLVIMPIDGVELDEDTFLATVRGRTILGLNFRDLKNWMKSAPTREGEKMDFLMLQGGLLCIDSEVHENLAWRISQGMNWENAVGGGMMALMHSSSSAHHRMSFMANAHIFFSKMLAQDRERTPNPFPDTRGPIRLVPA